MISKRAKEQFGVENFFLRLETLNSDDGIKKVLQFFLSFFRLTFEVAALGCVFPAVLR